MKKGMKLVCMVLTLAMLLGLLAGCGGKGGDDSNGAGKHTLIERLFVEDHIGLDATAARRAHGHARGILVLARANPFGAVDRAARLADIAVDRAVQLKHAP